MKNKEASVTPSEFLLNSSLYGANGYYVEYLYDQYLQDSNAVDAEWRKVFDQYKSSGGLSFPSVQVSRKSFGVVSDSPSDGSKNVGICVWPYRKFGHFLINFDPLGLEKSYFSNQFTPDLQSPYHAIYATDIGIECEHLSYDERAWMYERFEEIQSNKDKINYCRKELLKQLVAVEGMEQFLHIKFPGAKRFSVEGGETSIVCMDYVIKYAALPTMLGVNNFTPVDEVVVGMAHRGRLGTLTYVMGKPYEALFSEFAGKSAFDASFGIAGDVKYHMGYSNDKMYTCSCTGKDINASVHLTLTPNPSHLEAVNTVVGGRARAKQDRAERNGKSKRSVMSILVHGDAAFCGQGIVAEGIMMSSIEPYDVGGTVHIIVNNQVGFTAIPKDGRRTRYSTEFAKISGCPILHVNGYDVESVIRTTALASQYRHTFHKDVFIEIICYRKYGHNEGDEPMYTQPVMYSKIKSMKSVAENYAAQLQSKGIIDDKFFDQAKVEFKARMDECFEKSKSYKHDSHFLEGIWKGYSRENIEVITGLDKAILAELGEKISAVPTGFAINTKLAKQMVERNKCAKGEEALDYGTAEHLAFASLIAGGTNIRITGQDAERGTFSHRHSVWYDQNDNHQYTPLNNVGLCKGIKADKPGYYKVANSNLSEYGVLAFEFGYAMSAPDSLVIWEAQFGDFANGAQIVIDQFISTSETKWLRLNGLVMLLPHGYEGQGPEHTSGRIERYLQLAAEDNMEIVVPSVPASIFHVIRRQQMRTQRKPLIIFTPKSLLRHKLAVSKLDDIANGTQFQKVIGEHDAEQQNASKIIICYGKVYYDLLQYRMDNNIKNVAIIRLEQLYPFPHENLVAEIKKYAKVKDIVFCQEEAYNMGAWTFVYANHAQNLQKDVGCAMRCVSRPSAASPAVGYLKVHQEEQNYLVKKAFE